MGKGSIGKWAYKTASEKYDAVLIGAGISGLGVGGLLAKKGKKVLILEKNHTVGGKGRSFEIQSTEVFSSFDASALKCLTEAAHVPVSRLGKIFRTSLCPL